MRECACRCQKSWSCCVPACITILFGAMKEVDVQIRRAHGLEDYQRVVELEREVWSFTDTADLTAVPILMIANEFGGLVLVAEESSGRLIGFSMANLGWTRDKKLFWWSHMTAVARQYQSRGVGFRLKLRQREEALASGIDGCHGFAFGGKELQKDDRVKDCSSNANEEVLEQHQVLTPK